MARAQASPDALRQFAKDLRRAQEDVRSLTKNLERRMSALDWEDDVKRHLEGDVRAVGKGLLRFVGQLDGYAKQIERKAADLERYLT
jgi:uncharacterized protein YukE